MTIEYADWATVAEPHHVRTMANFDHNDRFQHVAIKTEINRIVGYWSYTVRYRRGDAVINSYFTRVLRAYRNHGVATKLWLAGIKRWDARRVTATAATYRGAEFLAAMKIALIKHGLPTVLDASPGEFHGRYHRAVESRALVALHGAYVDKRLASARSSALQLVGLRDDK